LTTLRQNNETVTLSQAKGLVKTLAMEQSLLLLSPPGIGKSETVAQAAREAGLPLRSLLGTQIAPEDVSGIPRIVGERSVFCPPRILLPEKPEPFCLFLDELPATSPDIQKAFYSLLLERRLGEHFLPKGTWVVAAGNRMEDRALVRAMSSALVNRVCLLNVRVDNKEWLTWGRRNGIRTEILSFILFMPEALMRTVPNAPVPFSTPRSWTLLSRALDRVETAGELASDVRRALAFGRISAEDAAIFCAVAENEINNLRPVVEYLNDPGLLPAKDTARWFVISRIRQMLNRGEFPDVSKEALNKFLMALPQEHRFSLFVDLVHIWGDLGAEQAMLDSLAELTGI
jgi:hypothetical protein